jgi:hypothetical protein
LKSPSVHFFYKASCYIQNTLLQTLVGNQTTTTQDVIWGQEQDLKLDTVMLKVGSTLESAANKYGQNSPWQASGFVHVHRPDQLGDIVTALFNVSINADSRDKDQEPMDGLGR